jgi:hypothetical protein
LAEKWDVARSQRQSRDAERTQCVCQQQKHLHTLAVHIILNDDLHADAYMYGNRQHQNDERRGDERMRKRSLDAGQVSAGETGDRPDEKWRKNKIGNSREALL